MSEEIKKRYGFFNYPLDKWWQIDGKDAVFNGREELNEFRKSLIGGSDEDFEELQPENGWEVRELPDPLTLPEMAVITPIGTTPAYSPFGYIIDKEGTVYSLIKAHIHGAICAVLCPNVPEGRDPNKVPVRPLSEVPVFAWQEFELENQAELDVVRIALRPFSDTQFNVSGSKYRVTERQIGSIIAVAALHDIKGTSHVQTGAFKTMKLNQLVDELRQGKPLYDFD